MKVRPNVGARPSLIVDLYRLYNNIFIIIIIAHFVFLRSPFFLPLSFINGQRNAEENNETRKTIAAHLRSTAEREREITSPFVLFLELLPSSIYLISLFFFFFFFFSCVYLVCDGFVFELGMDDNQQQSQRHLTPPDKYKRMTSARIIYFRMCAIFGVSVPVLGVFTFVSETDKIYSTRKGTSCTEAGDKNLRVVCVSGDHILFFVYYYYYFLICGNITLMMYRACAFLHSIPPGNTLYSIPPTLFFSLLGLDGGISVDIYIIIIVSHNSFQVYTNLCTARESERGAGVLPMAAAPPPLPFLLGRSSALHHHHHHHHHNNNNNNVVGVGENRREEEAEAHDPGMLKPYLVGPNNCNIITRVKHSAYHYDTNNTMSNKHKE
eukprot:gene6819-4899_t